MNTDYHVHSVDCFHLLTVRYDAFESSPALLKIAEGYIDRITHDL